MGVSAHEHTCRMALESCYDEETLARRDLEEVARYSGKKWHGTAE